MKTITEDMPCNCRNCHACAIFGIAYPINRPALTQPPSEAAPLRAERRPAVATLFDQLKSEELA